MTRNLAKVMMRSTSIPTYPQGKLVVESSYPCLISFVRIKNPLAHIPEEKLLSQVDAFAEEHDMLNIRDDLRKGALVAKSPDNYEKVSGLDDEEKLVLYNEVHRKWKQPTALYVTIVTCSIGAAVQWVFIAQLYALHLRYLQRMGSDRI